MKLNELKNELNEENLNEAPESGQLRFRVLEDNIENNWLLTDKNTGNKVNLTRGKKFSISAGSYILELKRDTDEQKELDKYRQRELLNKERKQFQDREKRI